MTISLVVSDVDGTLVTDEKVLTPATVAAVRRIKEAGVNFTIVSSRPPRGLRMIAETLELAHPFAGFNGGVVVRPDFSVVTQHLLPSDVAARAVELISAHGVQVWVFAGQDWFLRDSSAPYVERELRTVRFPPTEVADLAPALGAAAKIVGVSADFELLRRCCETVRAALAGTAEVARSQLYYLDITHPLANKGNALLEFAKLFAVPPAEIAVIGDGENDLAMFAHAALRVAMGNAQPHVQRAADHVTSSNREDGFADAVDRFILPAVAATRKPGGRDALAAQ
jgi:Cof subfamily protein (haloacid dehalogenase superfamily)